MTLPRHTITVSTLDRKVVVQDHEGAVLKVFSVYVGSERYPTRPGQFEILDDQEIANTDPAYHGLFLPFHEYPDPDNVPGGREWIAVAGFHGWKYGPEDDEWERTHPGWKTSTEGCIQMRNEDMAEFAGIVGPGDTVIVLESSLPPELVSPFEEQPRQHGEHDGSGAAANL